MGRSRAPSDLLEVEVGERLKGREGSGENAHAIGAQIVVPDARFRMPFLRWLIVLMEIVARAAATE